MYKIYISIVALLLIAVLSACGGTNDSVESSEDKKASQEAKADGEQQMTESSPEQQFSNSLGILSGSEIHGVVAKLSQEEFDKGFTDGFQSAEPAYPTASLSDALTKLEKHATESATTDTDTEQPEPSLYDPGENEKQLSYALGYIRGNQVSQFASELEIDTFLAAFAEAYMKAPENIDAEQENVRAYIDASQKKLANEREKQVSINLEKGEQFLAKNKEKDGVITTDSGLQYVVLEPGSGTKPKDTDSVEVHYEGKLLDGSVFDSSYQRNKTATFPLKNVISGWTEGLQYMPVGSKYRFFIHPRLAYGTQGSGKIGPNELLLFDVELIAIQ